MGCRPMDRPATAQRLVHPLGNFDGSEDIEVRLRSFVVVKPNLTLSIFFQIYMPQPVFHQYQHPLDHRLQQTFLFTAYYNPLPDADIAPLAKSSDFQALGGCNVD